MENMSDALLTDDQHFLLYLILGAYFAPDLKEGRPRKSALQRHAEGLPQYHANDLAGSCIKTIVIENVYYNILGKAEQSAVVKQPLLLQYIYGSLPVPVEGHVTYLRFDDLFPPRLHQRSQSEYQQGTIGSIVFINNPEIDYMKPGDIERFKRLTRLADFVLDREMLPIILDDRALYNRKMQETSKHDGTMQHLRVQHHDYLPSIDRDPDAPSQMVTSSGEDMDQGVIFLPSCPSREEWSNLAASINRGFALTGSAARGHLGPVLGLIDIGESEDSYLFRVSLPGVRRDERDFSCEVESDGTVIIKGVTVTGEKTVEKYSQVFEMPSQNLCPPGPFSISFKLPGPVDPRQFHGTFATDGILEGIALKERRYRS